MMITMGLDEGGHIMKMLVLTQIADYYDSDADNDGVWDDRMILMSQ